MKTIIVLIDNTRMEAEFMNMFYDMLRDDPKEYMRRKKLLDNRKKEVTKEMESRLSEIRFGGLRIDIVGINQHSLLFRA